MFLNVTAALGAAQAATAGVLAPRARRGLRVRLRVRQYQGCALAREVTFTEAATKGKEYYNIDRVFVRRQEKRKEVGKR